MGEESEFILQMDLLWLAYLSGQYSKETLEWHKRNTPGFNDYVSQRLAAIMGDEVWANDDNGNNSSHGKT